ncbi:MAG: type B 50S ribosomal protein L31 [Bacteriovoracaceae bacterium]|nr:type B 50S ribosomal protein L31 [Bacteriovoracaceae bacterium]
MKQGIHPEYNEVVFQDVSTGFSFKSRSTMKASKDQTIKWEDGNEYPLIKLDVSSASHPFYTGKQKILDTEGRIEKFKKKFGSTYMAKKK